MIEIQKFKPNDDREEKVIDAFLQVIEPIEDGFDSFYAGAYSTYSLGDVMFALQRDYIASAISQELYRIAFYKIHELGDRIGTFETYLEIFRAIWGDDVEIVFSSPAPGILNINAGNLGVALYQWVAERIEGMSFVFDPVVDHETPTPDNIVFQSTIGINVQEGMNRFIKMISVHGITTTCTLVF
jgi:hypothetical protein